MYCTNCGAENTVAANFCATCGNTILGSNEIETAGKKPKRTAKAVFRLISLWFIGLMTGLIIVELLLGLRLPPMALLSAALWTGIFCAIYARSRRAVWFFGGIVLGLAMVNLAAYIGALYRSTLP